MYTSIWYLQVFDPQVPLYYITHLKSTYNYYYDRTTQINADDGGQDSPGGRLYLRSRPVGLEGVTQSMVTSFLRHWSMSTALKKATDWGRSFKPNAWANTLLQETQAHTQESCTVHCLFHHRSIKYAAAGRPRQQVCDLQCQRCSVTVFASDEVPHFIVDADAETAIDVVLLKEPLHGHQHQMEVVHRRALHHPVHSARDKLTNGIWRRPNLTRILLADFWEMCM